MSIGEQKPGGNKMSDLKARLSALNKGGATGATATPQGPAATGMNAVPATPAPKPATTANKLNIDFNAAAPRTASPTQPNASSPFAQPSASASEAPKPTAKPSLFGGEDLFAQKSQTKTVPAATPSAAPVPSTFAPAAPASTFAPAAPQQEEEPENPADAFANPMQKGRFYEPATPLELSADDEAALSAYEKGQKGIKPMMAYTVAGALTLIALIFGIFLGDSRYSRRMINSQIDSSINLQKTLTPLFDQVNAITPILKALKGNSQSVDWDKMKLIPKELPEIDAGALLATPVPLRKEVTQTLNKWLTDTNLLFANVRQHVYLTLARDKQELENLEKGNSFWNNPETIGYAVKYESANKDGKNAAKQRPTLTAGTFVAVVGQLVDGDDGFDRLMPVRYQTKEDIEMVSLRNLVIMNKDELQSGGGGNPLTNYQSRCQEIFTIVQRLEQTQEQLVTLLKEEANRSKVFQF